MRPNFKNSNRPKAKSKMTITSFEKEFETFEDMIADFKTLHPEFANIFHHEVCTTANEAAYDVLDYYLSNIPNVAERTNLPLSVTVTANRVALKTCKFFSFDWNFTYDKEGNISNLVATISVFTKEKNTEDVDKLMNTLTNAWSIKETRA
jgi:hypothetical protein